MAKENPQQFLHSCECSTPANNILRVPWLGSTAGSTASWPPSTNAPDGYSSVFSRDNTVAEASPCWHGSRDWIAIPSPAASTDCNGSVGSSPAASGAQAPDAPALKKKSRASDHLGGTAPRCDRRRPDLRAEVDASIAA